MDHIREFILSLLQKETIPKSELVENVLCLARQKALKFEGSGGDLLRLIGSLESAGLVRETREGMGIVRKKVERTKDLFERAEG